MHDIVYDIYIYAIFFKSPKGSMLFRDICRRHEQSSVINQRMYWCPYDVLESSDVGRWVLAEDDAVGESLVAWGRLYGDAIVGLCHLKLRLGSAHLGSEIGGHTLLGHGLCQDLENWYWWVRQILSYILYYFHEII